MRTRIAITGSLLALGTALAPVAANAEGDLPAPEVSFVHQNVIVTGAHQDEATVLAKYRCYGGEEGTHLWVSVKQGDNLEAEGSSQWATSWYDTNYQWAENPAGQTIDCDGRWHATRFTVKRVEGWGELERGSAWVQFCVYDSEGRAGSFNGYKTVKIS
ncbi:MAG TPA: hypothetical protein VFK34_03295 [Marmoricola sp.]|jgi:hypothetical protein|nr:hypothetical protein [Marmoricola sp.]